MDLRDYEQAKFELASLLRTAAAIDPRPTDEVRARFQDLFARLAEDRFNLVVVGRFSRGKTSLMNAIMGTDRLPIGIVPLTSVITTVGYGSEEAALIHFQGTGLTTTIPLDALSEYITQRHNPGNVRRVQTAEIQLPVEILRRGFRFVDTPGLGSSIRENTLTTEAFLPEADAFVLVTSFESPLSVEELQVLHEASATARRVFVVVNKQDTVSADERDEVMRFVRARLNDLPSAAAAPIYSVSARDGIAARRAGDAGRLAESGIPLLESDLTRFLLEDKRREFLLRFCDRVAGSLPSFAKDGSDVSLLGARLRHISERLTDARGRARPPAGVAPDTDAALARLEACEICRAITVATFDFLRRFQYQLTVDPQAQRQHAEQGGFCPLHTWEYATIALTHSICTGYPTVLERMSEQLRAIASEPGSANASATRVRALLPTEHRCAACLVRAAAQEKGVEHVVEGSGIDPATASTSRSALCLPHFSLVLARLEHPRHAEALIDREARILDRVAEDMRRYATKRDALRRQLASAEEMAAGKRAIELVAGLRNVHFVTCPS